MPNYSQIQFISWEIYTGPVETKTDNDDYEGVWYQGISDPNALNTIDINSQIKDIEARVAFTRAALAAGYEKADKDPSTLKLFMAPEFLYRGSGGAYVHDLMHGWEATAPFTGTEVKDNYPGLFGFLKQEIADEKYKDWIFVFGTAISAMYEAKTNEDGKIQLINGATVFDLDQSVTAFNFALLQCGGPTKGNADDSKTRWSMKQYKSKIDFIKSRYLLCKDKGDLTDESVHHLSKVEDIPKKENTVFSFDHILDKEGNKIEIGIEICLDHFKSTDQHGVKNVKYGRVRSVLENSKTKERVKIQLIPSGGMSLIAESIWLALGTDSYAFNCDGLSLLDDTNIFKLGAHTQIRRQKKDHTNENDIIGNFGDPFSIKTNDKKEFYIKVPDIIDDSNSAKLWNNGQGISGAGFVRVLPPLPL